MPSVVKFLVTEDGEDSHDDTWHLVHSFNSDPAALCSGQHFGYGQGRIEERGVDYEVKEGRVTCERCRSFIRAIKGVSLK